MIYFSKDMFKKEDFYLRNVNEVEIDGQNQDQDDNNQPQDFTTPDPVDPTGRNNNNEDANPPDNNENTEDFTQDDGGGNNDDASVDNTGGGDDANPPDSSGGDEPEDFTQSDGGGNNDDSFGGGGDDFGGGGDANGEGGDAGGDTGGGGGGDVEQTADDARGLENELFKDLTPSQLDVKHKELKNNFLELYDTTNNIITRVNDIPTDEQFRSTIAFVNKQLSSLRDLITDYMNNIYSTKSYMENAINYNRFLATLNGINAILKVVSEEIGKNNDNDNS